MLADLFSQEINLLQIIKKYGCAKARVHTLQNNIITYVGERNHSLLHGDKDVHVIRSAIKRRAVQGEERSRQVSAICVK